MQGIEITHDELAKGINNLGNAMNANMGIISNRTKVLFKLLEEYCPGIEDKYKKEMFKQQCTRHFVTIERARNSNNPDALEIIKINSAALEALKKLGKENDWLSAYNKAAREAAHITEGEQAGDPPPLEIV